MKMVKVKFAASEFTCILTKKCLKFNLLFVNDVFEIYGSDIEMIFCVINGLMRHGFRFVIIYQPSLVYAMHVFKETKY